MKQLQLPITVRTARPEEIPMNSPEYLERIVARNDAKIIEGFTIENNPDNESLFFFYSKINVDNSRLWELFKTLLLTFEDEISFMYGENDDELHYSTYMGKFEILNKISSYEVELTEDGFLCFGVIYYDESTLHEVFVQNAKYIQYWGKDIIKFREVMNTFSIVQFEHLNFIDEYPIVTEALDLFKSGVRIPSEVILYFNENI